MLRAREGRREIKSEEKIKELLLEIITHSMQPFRRRNQSAALVCVCGCVWVCVCGCVCVFIIVCVLVFYNV